MSSFKLLPIALILLFHVVMRMYLKLVSSSVRGITSQPGWLSISIEDMVVIPEQAVFSLRDVMGHPSVNFKPSMTRLQGSEAAVQTRSWTAGVVAVQYLQ